MGRKGAVRKKETTLKAICFVIGQNQVQREKKKSFPSNIQYIVQTEAALLEASRNSADSRG